MSLRDNQYSAVVIGTGFIGLVRRGICESVHMFPADDERVEKSQLGDDAGVRRAVALAVQELESR